MMTSNGDLERLLWENDATGLAERIANKDISPVEAVEAAIARAERTAPKINAIAERLFESARETARSCPSNRPFAGVPIAIKDLGISLKGVPNHSGSRVKPLIPREDSTLVTRYREAGFIPVATTTTAEFGLRLVTETARFGVTRNPWNTGHVTGGSSGGAAAIVAAGVVPVAHASDGGGSIRVPAACCGLVGMKPSRGRVPLTPDMQEGWFGLIAQHVVCRSVRDSAAILDLTAGPDRFAPYAALPPSGTFAAAAAKRPEKLKIGVYRDSPLGLDISAETLAAIDEAVALCREACHDVEETGLPVTRRFLADFAKMVATSIAGQARLESDRFTGSGQPERVARILRRFGEMIGGGELSQSVLRLQGDTQDILRATDKYDAVLMPLIAHPPLPTGGLDPKGLDLLNERLLDALRLTWLLKMPPLLDQLTNQSLWFTHWPAIQNVTGQPAIAMPIHQTASGLPLGIQAVGRPGDEETLFSLAGQIEELSGWRSHRAPLEMPD
jgi:amidase